MVKLASDKLWNNTTVPFKTRWTSYRLDNPIIIEPFTPMNEIIAKLEKAKNQKFTFWQTVDMKHFYQKFRKTDRNISSKRKSCLGWSVEYMIEGEYTRFVDVNKIKNDRFAIPKNAVYIHELFPVIQSLKLEKEVTKDELSTKLNFQIQTFNAQIFAWKINTNLKSFYWGQKNVSLEVIRKSIKRTYSFLSDFEKKLENLQTISSNEVQELYADPNKSIKGWVNKK